MKDYKEIAKQMEPYFDAADKRINDVFTKDVLAEMIDFIGEETHVAVRSHFKFVELVARALIFGLVEGYSLSMRDILSE